MTDTPQMDVAAAEAAGVQVTEPVLANYWGFEETTQHVLPDGVQYFEIKKMNEGDKAKYQSATRSDIRLQRQTGDAHLKADPAAERHALLMACVVGWKLFGPDGKELKFNKDAGPFSFKSWLSGANPKIVEDLEKACRKFNPWLMADMSVEDIDREIENLNEMREVALKREQGE